jgi:hypothetical protein
MGNDGTDPISDLLDDAPTQKGQISVYTPKTTPADDTSYYYNPPVTGSYKPSALSPVDQVPMPPTQPDVFPLESTIFGKPYQPAPVSVPGREDKFFSGKNVRQELSQIPHDLGTLSAGAASRFSRALWQAGGAMGDQPQALLSKEDLDELGQMGRYVIPGFWHGERYARPLLHGDVSTIVRNTEREPISATLDALPILGAFKGPLKKMGQAIHATEAGKNALGAAKVGIATIANKIPEMAAGAVLKKVLGKMTPEEIQELRKMDGELQGAWNKIDKKHRLHVIDALEQTDPAYAHLLDDPAVANYRNVQDKWHKLYWKKLADRKLVTDADRLATQVFPRYAAAVARGDIPMMFPIDTLRSGSVYDPLHGEALQRELKQFEAVENAVDPEAFKGSYNPVLFKKQVAAFDPAAPIKPGELKKRVVGQREAAHIETSHYPKFSDEGLPEMRTGIGGKERSLEAAQNMAQKLTQTAQFLNLYDKLESVSNILDALPPAVRQIVADEVIKTLEPLMAEVGLDERQLKHYAHISQVAAQQLTTAGATFRNSLRSIKEGISAAATGYNWLFGWTASLQRGLALAGDMTWPWLLSTQQAVLWFGTSDKTPRSLLNGFIAMRLASNPKVFEKIPREFLETRNIQSNHPIINLLNKPTQMGYDMANGVRGMSCIQEFMNEYDALEKPVQETLLNKLGKVFDLSAAYNDFRQVGKAIEGGKGFGRTKKEWEAFVQKVKDTRRAIFGHYQGPYTKLHQTMRTTSIWFNMQAHFATLTKHMLENCSYEIGALRGLAKVSGGTQIMAGKSKDLPDWAIKLGAVPTGIPSPDGTAMVNYPPGLDLVLEAVRALRMGNAAAAKIFRDSPIEMPDEDVEPEMQLNFWFTAKALWTGHMPNGHPIRNPFQLSLYGKTYDLNDVAKKLEETGQMPPLAGEVVTSPYSHFLDKVWSTGRYGLFPKKGTQLERLSEMAGGYQASNVSVPFLANRAYPKINLKEGKLEPGYPHSPLELVPGMTRVLPHVVPTKTEFNKQMQDRKEPPPFRFNRRLGRALPSKQLTPQAKAYQAAIQLNKIKKSVRGELLPK